MATVDHDLSHEDALHTDWDAARDPALTVASGDVVRFDCLNDSGPRITPETRADDLPETEFVGHHLTGPVAVAGADPGDTLQVEVLDVTHDDWGYTLVRSGETGSGLLPGAFPDPHLRHWDLDADAGVGRFADAAGPAADVAVPLSPFPGVMGVAPADPGPHSTSPPRRVGGNLDTKHLTPGSTLFLPVEAAGALFSVGDGHAAQGDGEVCVSAIETPTTVTLRFSVRPDYPVEAPEFRTAGPFGPPEDEAAYATAGVADDLMAAAKDATRRLIEHLHDDHGLSRPDAYVLCSVAADLKINEVVDAPNWVVSAYLPEQVLP